MRDFSGETIVVIGAARQGAALGRYLLEHGAHVRITDQRSPAELESVRQSLEPFVVTGDLEWVCGGHPLSLLEGASLVCPSGGVPLTLPLIEEARRRGVPLSNDSQIFLEAAPCTVIGITGSAGKTTTTTLVGRMAQAAVGAAPEGRYRRTWVGGNIGSPLISMLEQMAPQDLAVMELSSFQLELMSRSPQIAAILNLTPNHLDRHRTMRAYTRAKAQIILHQNARDSAVLGRDDPGAWSLARDVQGLLYSFGLTDLPEGQAGAYLQDQVIFLRVFDSQTERLEDQLVMSRQAIGLRGEHNVLNVMAACTLASAAGLPVEVMRLSVEGFAGVPHRLEYVRTWGGADWYNDSIATAPERAMAAIRSFQEPLVLLAGGRDKKLPWDEFAKLARERVRHLILFGEASEIILEALKPAQMQGLAVSRCNGLHDAVQRAAEVVQPGEVVLLSPGGTSFDEFIDFEERGACFARWVRELP